jgi:two-component system, LuxR family, sensor kinase FixL
MTPIVDDSLARALIATAVDGIVVFDENGIVRVFNSACEKLFGYESSEVLEQNVEVLMPAPYRGENDGYLSHVRKTGEDKVVGRGREVVGQRKNGSTFPMYLSVGEGVADDTPFFVGIIHDLSAIRAEEEHSKASDRHRAAIVDSSNEIILSKTLDGIIVSWNPGAERIFGYKADEMIGKSIFEIIPQERFAEEDTILQGIRAGKKIESFETIRKRRDGTIVDVSLSISPLYDAHGIVIGAAKIARDITAHKRAQALAAHQQSELAHTSRINAMGQLSSALAHELNQPLTATMNFINAARRRLKNPKDIDKASVLLDSAVEQVIRAGKIIQRLRAFLEKREPSRVADSINDIVREAIALGFVGAADRNVELVMHLTKAAPTTFADRVQIEQVIVNLVRNANEAMQSEKTRRLTVSTFVSDDGFVEVTVADTGPGISPDIAKQLFEPFITTKAKGMGVGLSLCRTILEAHEGRIWATSNAEGGATFHFRLPMRVAE